MLGGVASSSATPKTCPTSFAVTANFFGASNSRAFQAKPGRLASKMRTEAPSGSMKVTSAADLLRGSAFGGGTVPEKPVTTVSPSAMLGDGWLGCAPAVPIKQAKANNGASRAMMLAKVNPRGSWENSHEFISRRGCGARFNAREVFLKSFQSDGGLHSSWRLETAFVPGVRLYLSADGHNALAPYYFVKNRCSLLHSRMPYALTHAASSSWRTSQTSGM